MEDEVDWSDSPLGSETPVATHEESSSSEGVGTTSQQGFPYDCGSHEQRNLSSAEEVDGRPRLKLSLGYVQRPQVATRLNRRKPTREDYTNFVLYQGSQKVYEAIFLKNFLVHALHPNQLDDCLRNGRGHRESIYRYLQSISDNVNRIVTKMVWSTHSRTTNFMASDGKDTTPFWDFHQFDKQCFRDFSSNNTFSVVDAMKESWHKAFRTPSMVRYTAKQYPIGTHASPFEEIDDATGASALFDDGGTALVAPHDRVVHRPHPKKSETHNQPGATLRETSSISRTNWLQDLEDYGIAKSSSAIQAEKMGPPPNQHDTTQRTNVYEHQMTRTGADDVAYIADGNKNNAGTINSVSIADPLAEESTRPEALEAFHGPSILLEKPFLSPIMQDTSSEGAGEVRCSWRTWLIEDHKRRLASKYPQSQQPPKVSMGFKFYIGRALDSGALKPLVPDLQRIIDYQVHKERTGMSTLPPQPKLPQDTYKPMRQPVQPETSDHRGSVLPAAPIGRHRGNSVDVPKIKPTHSKRPSNASAGKPNKRRKLTGETKGPKVQQRKKVRQSQQLIAKASSASLQGLEITSNPGRSKTLEDHQKLPDGAYFMRTFDDEQPAWRCGISHAMGYYYNAGDRKNCAGCFTSAEHNPKRKTMDFYLPSRSHFFQPAPGVVWKPSKQRGTARRSKHMSHNSIAKDAYYIAIDNGATMEEAWQKGIEAVEEHLRPKTPQKEPTPEPTPEPIDLGPHPSGSKTMEHGQQIPVGFYFEKQQRNDEFAWRCEVNHALGRYYLAGDVKTCPGCGSSSTGLGKRTRMDFYLPRGTIVRQKAQGLVNWRPRKPYNLSKTSKKQKQAISHNQYCSKKYRELIDEGCESDKALELAIEATDAHIDAKNESTRAKLAQSAFKDSEDSEDERGNVRNEHGSEMALPGGQSSAYLISTVPNKRHNEVLNDREREEVTEYETGQDTDPHAPETVSISSDDESSSDSDSQ